MSNQTVTLRVPIESSWDGGTRLQVYCDKGTGTVDPTKPLLARPVAVFPGQHAAVGLGRQPVGRGRVGDSKPARKRRGLGRTRVGITPVGRTPPVIDITVHVPPAFGTWKFAVQAIDRDGNVQTDALQEIAAVVSGTEPAPPKSFAMASYDSGSDQVTFDFSTDAE